MYDLAKVTKVYSGKRGCMCGCKGKYAYAEGVPHEDWQGTVNAAAVKRTFNRVVKNSAAQFDEIANCLYVDTATRSTVVYFE
jgi:hypothetical protein